MARVLGLAARQKVGARLSPALERLDDDHELDLYPKTSPHEANKAPKAGPRLAPWQEVLAKRALIDRLDGPISISEVAGLCRLSVSHFVRAFNRTVGIAPYRWLLDRRIDHAKLLLEAAALPLAEIALDCGFGDQSHFTNMFVRRAGVTPRQWREQFARPGSSSRRRSLKQPDCELCHQRPTSEFLGGCGAMPNLCGRVSSAFSP